MVDQSPSEVDDQISLRGNWENEQPIVVVRFFHLLLWIFWRRPLFYKGKREFEFLMECDSYFMGLWCLGLRFRCVIGGGSFVEWC